LNTIINNYDVRNYGIPYPEVSNWLNFKTFVIWNLAGSTSQGCYELAGTPKKARSRQRR